MAQMVSDEERKQALVDAAYEWLKAGSEFNETVADWWATMGGSDGVPGSYAEAMWAMGEAARRIAGDYAKRAEQRDEIGLRPVDGGEFDGRGEH